MTTTRDLDVQSRLLDQHHKIGNPGRAYANGHCPTCRYGVAADASGTWEHWLAAPTDALAVRGWLEDRRQVRGVAA
jgi:hypothetical protein